MGNTTVRHALRRVRGRQHDHRHALRPPSAAQRRGTGVRSSVLGGAPTEDELDPRAADAEVPLDHRRGSGVGPRRVEEEGMGSEGLVAFERPE
ncbi:hypothetical protein NL676_026147 [Syzygium grande]|nr:hypothetical protein NL676_026147 [Syzygium grande]